MQPGQARSGPGKGPRRFSDPWAGPAGAARGGKETRVPGPSAGLPQPPRPPGPSQAHLDRRRRAARCSGRGAACPLPGSAPRPGGRAGPRPSVPPRPRPPLPVRLGGRRRAPPARGRPGAGQVGARAGGVWAGRSGSEPRAGRAGGRSPSTWPCRPRHLARPHLAGGCPRDPRPAGCSPAGRSPPAAAPWGRAPRPPLPRPLPVAGVACGCGAPGLPHCNPQSAAALLQARLRCVCCLQLQEALPVAGQPCG